MKGRPKTIRKISFIPAVSGFRPYGDRVEKGRKKCVFLLYEEYESLRLNDYERHSQSEAAELMQVSRPTFTRIYKSAREKIAQAFVEGLRIVVEGGKVELDSHWWVCRKCKALFSRDNGEDQICALCGSGEVESYAGEDSDTVAPASLHREKQVDASRLRPVFAPSKRCGKGQCRGKGNCLCGKK